MITRFQLERLLEEAVFYYAPSNDDAARGYMHIKSEVTARAVGLLEQTLAAGFEDNDN